MKTILVTGGGGFIGSNLVAALLERGTHDVAVCDAFGGSEKWRNLAKHPVSEIIMPEQLFDWLDTHHQQLDMIFHLASVSSTTEKNIDLILKHNFALSLKLWRWCGERGVRLVYASSGATYGDGSQGFDDILDLAQMRRLIPLSGYGWSKHLFDMHVAATAPRASRPQWVGLKFFNTYGPNEYHKDDQRSVITKMAEQAIQGAAVRLFRSYNSQYPNGEQKRDVIYVKDNVRVMLWCLDHPEVSGLFNLGTGRASTFNEMAAAIFSAIGRKPNISYIDMPADLVPKYQYFTEARIDRLRAAGYTDPFTPLEHGVRDYVQNYLLKDDRYL
ncbi:MAG: ADP-glyceromanno-heptose 6-epimerase [Pseudomonadota bacterium]|nr:ADP-glyceromanno-heptose 6-epimerase [Pseudomonadota bacterium]